MKKTALVTGASRGIGKAIVLALAEVGYSIALGYNKSSADAKSLENELTHMGCDALLVKGDICNVDDIRSIISQTIKRFGRIDVLVNNAGVLPRLKGDFDSITEEIWDTTIDTNLKGAMFCIIEAAKHMITQDDNGDGIHGRIINMSSIGAIRATRSPHYSASKAGLIGLTISMAEWLGPYGILVNAVSPGFVNTSMVDAIRSIRNYIEDQTPLGRWGEPNDVADVVRFLAESGNFVTGQVICVDGGLGNTYIYIPRKPN
jgi:3-oxoacyl-[acyl-carrier protein] reductase